MPSTNDAKRELRRVMRPIRRRAALDPLRSAAIVARLVTIPEVVAARTVVSFDPVVGEPDLSGFGEWLRARGAVVVAPLAEPHARHPITSAEVDVVIVPGLAFTEHGGRLGQGGGWYDRFLRAWCAGATVIGVCFDEQIVEVVPTEPHDVPMAYVVTPTSTYRHTDADDPGAAAPGSSSSER